MEITNEIKAKVFAQYLGQKFTVYNSAQKCVTIKFKNHDKRRSYTSNA